MSGRPAHGTILMYHRLVREGAAPDEGDYALGTGMFEDQMRALAAQRRPVVPLSAMADARFPDGAVVLTFDDGCDTDATVALPVLRSFGFTAAFFVNPARVGQPGRATWPQLEALAAVGMTVGSHGLDHTLLGGLSAAALEEQLVRSKALLERHLGREVDALSLPGGSGGARAARLARAAGYRLICGSRPGRVSSRAMPDLLPRYAVRYSEGLGGFQAMLDQPLAFRLRQALRHHVLGAVRAVVGEPVYARLRQAHVARRTEAPRS